MAYDHTESYGSKAATRSGVDQFAKIEINKWRNVQAYNYYF